MDNALSKFIIKAIITALICYVVAFLIQGLLFKSASFIEVFFLIPFVMFITIGFHVLLVKASKSNNMLFVNKFLAFSGMKLMLYLFTIILYALFIKFEIIIFLISFVIIYFTFTITEVASLLKFFKKS